MFPSIKNLAINVDIAPTASICRYEKNNSISSQTQTNCLSDEDVISVINQILLRLPNIGYFRLQLLSHLSLDYYFPTMKFNSLEHLSVIGFRVTFNRPLYSVSTQFSNLELEGGNIHSFEEISFHTCCKKLRNLFLGFNEIGSVSKPLQVKGLNVLSYLVLRNNRIRKIEDINFLRSFKELFSINLNDNQISFVGSLAFADLKKLKSISLKGNWLNSIPMFRSIGGSPYFLWELILSDNNITEFDSNPLKELSCLARLDLSDNFIDKLHFSHLPSLKKLILSNNCIEYFKVDGSSHNLKSLRLDGNKLTNFTEDQIIIFNTSKSNLFELDLSRNPFRNCGMFTDWTHDHELRLLIDDDYSQYAWNFSTFHKVLKLKNIHQFVCHEEFDEVASNDSQTVENEFTENSATTQYSDFEDQPTATLPVRKSVSLEDFTFDKQTIISMQSVPTDELTSEELDTMPTTLAADSAALPTSTFLVEASNLPMASSLDISTLYETESLNNFKELGASTTSSKSTETAVPTTTEPDFKLSSVLIKSRLDLHSSNIDWLSLSSQGISLTQHDAILTTESTVSTTVPTTPSTESQTERNDLITESVSGMFSLSETDSQDKLIERDKTTSLKKSTEVDKAFPRTESTSKSSATNRSHPHAHTSNINSSPSSFHGKNFDIEHSDNVIITTLESNSYSLENASGNPSSSTISQLPIIATSLMPKPFMYSKVTSKEHVSDDDSNFAFNSSTATFTTSSDISAQNFQDQLEHGFQTTMRHEFETGFADDYKNDFENPKIKKYSEPIGKTSMVTSQGTTSDFHNGFEEPINTLNTRTSPSTSEHLSKLEIRIKIATKQFNTPRKSSLAAKDFPSSKSPLLFSSVSIPTKENQWIKGSKDFLPPNSNWVTNFKKEFITRNDKKHIVQFPLPEKNLPAKLPSIFKESSAVFSTFQSDSFLSIVILLNCISSFLGLFKLH